MYKNNKNEDNIRNLLIKIFKIDVKNNKKVDDNLLEAIKYFFKINNLKNKIILKNTKIIFGHCIQYLSVIDPALAFEQIKLGINYQNEIVDCITIKKFFTTLDIDWAKQFKNDIMTFYANNKNLMDAPNISTYVKLLFQIGESETAVNIVLIQVLEKNSSLLSTNLLAYVFCYIDIEYAKEHKNKIQTLYDESCNLKTKNNKYIMDDYNIIDYVKLLCKINANKEAFNIGEKLVKERKFLSSFFFTVLFAHLDINWAKQNTNKIKNLYNQLGDLEENKNQLIIDVHSFSAYIKLLCDIGECLEAFTLIKNTVNNNPAWLSASLLGILFTAFNLENFPFNDKNINKKYIDEQWMLDLQNLFDTCLKLKDKYGNVIINPNCFNSYVQYLYKLTENMLMEKEDFGKVIEKNAILLSKNLFIFLFKKLQSKDYMEFFDNVKLIFIDQKEKEKKIIQDDTKCSVLQDDIDLVNSLYLEYLFNIENYEKAKEFYESFKDSSETVTEFYLGLVTGMSENSIKTYKFEKELKIVDYKITNLIQIGMNKNDDTITIDLHHLSCRPYIQFFINRALQIMTNCQTELPDKKITLIIITGKGGHNLVYHYRKEKKQNIELLPPMQQIAIQVLENYKKNNTIDQKTLKFSINESNSGQITVNYASLLNKEWRKIQNSNRKYRYRNNKIAYFVNGDENQNQTIIHFNNNWMQNNNNIKKI
jgi:hypothetical protein